MAIVKKISELTPKGSNLANTDLLIVGVDNGTDYDLKSVTGAQVLGNATSGLVPYTGATENVNLGEFELKAGQLSLDTTPTGTATVGTTRWNDALGSSETTLKGGSVVLKNGVDLVARVVNKVTPNTTLTKANYQVVRISGAQGQRLAVNLAQANNDNNSADTLGIVCETIATNAEGFIMTMGQLENINTTGSLQSETWVDGDVLYLSPTTAGKITNIKPTGATGHIVILGYVEYSHAINGKIYVKVMNGWELDELHNVSISNPLDKQLLSYENSTSLWKNKTVTTSDISDSTNKRYVTDANLTVIGNTSGTNTGDQDLQSVTNLGANTSNIISSQNATFQSSLAPSQIQTQRLSNSKRSSLNADGFIVFSTTGTAEATLKATNILNNVTLEVPNKSTGSYTIATTTDFSGTNTGDQDLSGLMVKSNNLSDLTNTTTARTNLGLGTLATQSGTFSGTSSGTNTGDQIISDATLTTSDITTNNVSTSKHGFVPKAPNNTTQFLRGDGTWGTPASGGLTYFTEAQNTTAPNATVPVDSLTAVTGTTDGDFAIIPKGAGAFIVGHIPDGGTGGNKRGAGAIEIQLGALDSNGGVASGTKSILIGSKNYATNSNTIAIGNGVIVTGADAIGIGTGNNVRADGANSFAVGKSGNFSSASGQFSIALLGGQSSGSGSFSSGNATASGTNSLALAGTSGEGATASSTNSIAIGKGTLSNAPHSISLGNWSSSKSIASKLSLGSFIDTAPYLVGSTQLGLSSSLANTTTNTAVELSTQGGTAICLTLQNNEAIRVKGSIIGKQTASTNVACYDFDCIVVRGTTAASTILPLSNVNLVLDTIVLDTIPTLTANTTLGGLSVKSGAKTTTTIKWSCRIDSTEVILA